MHTGIHPVGEPEEDSPMTEEHDPQRHVAWLNRFFRKIVGPAQVDSTRPGGYFEDATAAPNDSRPSASKSARTPPAIPTSSSAQRRPSERLSSTHGERVSTA